MNVIRNIIWNQWTDSKGQYNRFLRWLNQLERCLFRYTIWWRGGAEMSTFQLTGCIQEMFACLHDQDKLTKQSGVCSSFNIPHIFPMSSRKLIRTSLKQHTSCRYSMRKPKKIKENKSVWWVCQSRDFSCFHVCLSLCQVHAGCWSFDLCLFLSTALHCVFVLLPVVQTDSYQLKRPYQNNTPNRGMMLWYMLFKLAVTVCYTEKIIW